MEHFKLSSYKRKKGVLVSPWNEFMTPLKENFQWFKSRLPEYLWIGLILKSYERRIAIDKCLGIVKYLSEIEPSMLVPAWSEIMKMNDTNQKLFFSFLDRNINFDILYPLTCLTKYTNNKVFYQYFPKINYSIPERLNVIINLLKETSDHQTNESTDIRYIVLCHSLFSDKLRVRQEDLEMIKRYSYLPHENEEMCMIRPFIRATELMLLNEFTNIDNSLFLKGFWDIMSQSTDCGAFYINYAEVEMNSNDFVKQAYEVMSYYHELEKIQPLNNKLLVIVGIATYSYKRLKELVDHSLYYEISGRSIIRSLVENYIMIKYLIKNETKHDDIWSEFQYYGIGKYKLIVQKDREKGKTQEQNHLNFPYMEALVGEYTREDFINMDLRYFDNVGIREKAIEVGEKDLYDLLYDYDSQFEHGLWGAIRESSLLKCDNPAHQYHCITDIDDIQKLPSVWNDCKNVMLKTIAVLKDEFGLPDRYELKVD